MEKVVIPCKRCGQRLWVPSELGDIAVTCPKCRHRWDESGALLKRIAVAAAAGFAYTAGGQAAQAADLFSTSAAAAAPAAAAAAPEVTGAAVDAASQAGGDFWDWVGDIFGG